MPHSLEPNHWDVFAEAERYDRAGDVYHAVKLYKKVIRQVPDFAPPYRKLGALYRKRQEWKPAYHYWKKAVALQNDDTEAWWEMGLAATGLGRLRISRSVWTKFGLQPLQDTHPVGLRIPGINGFEILWMQPRDAGRGVISSIPQPGSDYRFRDEVLYDRRRPVGTHVSSKRRVNIHESEGLIKRSAYQTFSCLVHTTEEAPLLKLEELCQRSGIGFEIWSRASRQATPVNRAAFPEYYSDLLPQPTGQTSVVALAAIHPAPVQHTLNAWQIITLADYSDLRSY
ncbi:MAG: hypothetical protein WBA17_01200 [Saprospiraceae bacterium]